MGMKEEIIAGLTARDDRAACALADQIVAQSWQTDVWYDCIEEFAKLLSHPKSLVRNRALSLLAANARWDAQHRLDAILPSILAHITDKKPITARKCIQALAQLGTAQPKYIPDICNALQHAELSQYRDSMRPLIQRDIGETLRKLMYPPEA